jgi:hypothetical protein
MKPDDTNEPIPRATRPDAETPGAVHLFKKVPLLRATHQVRLLAFLAAQRGKVLVLHLPRSCRLDPALSDLVASTGNLIRREDLP